MICMVFFAIAAGVYKYHATITDNQAKKEELLQRSKQSVAEHAEGETAGKAESEPIVLENPVPSAVSFAVESDKIKIRTIIEMGREVGLADSEIINKLQDKIIGLPLSSAKSYLEQYGKQTR